MKAILTLRGKAKDVFAIIRRMAHQTTLTIQCAWCGLDMGQKDGQGQSGISHGICQSCIEKMEKENHMRNQLRNTSPFPGNTEGYCICAHRQLVHNDTPYSVGHAECLQAGCICKKFTWAAFRNEVTGFPQQSPV